ncbi:AfsR/SARP family transcriptional regulator [Kitasatospora sp. NPDC004531]
MPIATAETMPLPLSVAADGAERPAVEVQCMGGFSLTIDGWPVRRWHAGKARNLFQYLLVNRERVVLRDTLYEVLWPEQVWSPGSSSLKVAAHALRRMLATQPLVEGRAPIRIEHRDFGYVLHADGILVDAERLQAAFSAGRTAELRGDHAEASRHYREVTALYRGDYLAGESADWILEQREWYRSLALGALAHLREGALAAGDHLEAIRWSRQALAIDRYHEESYQTLMIAHGRLGELDLVRGWHELCARRLADELDLDPSPETDAILAQAMRGRLRTATTSRTIRQTRTQRSMS